MSRTPDLYALLPAIHRLRDAEQGEPLHALLDALQTQASELDDATAQLYANWFIETCEPHLVPYFAELVGLDLGPSLPADGAAVDATRRRKQVANAIGDRRRKGSLSVLEQLAADATGWPARAVELARLVASTHSIRFPEVGHRRLVDLTDGDALDVIHSALDSAAPLIDVRRLTSHRTPGTAHPCGVAVWLWRLAAERVDGAPAACCGDDSHYAFDQLGRDLPLAVTPSARAAGRRPATNLDVPVPITRVALERRLEDYYGPGRSICVSCDGEPVPRSRIVVADLGGWRHRTPPGRVAIDPELGRIAFPMRQPPEEGVTVTCARQGIGAIGGGDYERPLDDPAAGVRIYYVDMGETWPYSTVADALSAWAADKRADPARSSALIQIDDDGVYEERFDIALAAGEHLEIRASQGRRPVLVAVEKRSNRPDHVRVTGPEIAREPPPAEAAGRGGYGSDAPAPAEAAGRGGYGGAAPAQAPAGGRYGSAAREAAGRGYGSDVPAPAKSRDREGYAGAEPQPAETRDGGGYGSSAKQPPPDESPHRIDDPPTLTLDGIWVAGHLELDGQLGDVTLRHCTLVPARGLENIDGARDAGAPSLVVRGMPCPVSITSSVVGRVRVESPEVGFDPVALRVTTSVLDAGDLYAPAIDGGDERRAWALLTLDRVTVLGGAHVHEVARVEDSLLTGALRCERRQVGVVRCSYVAPDSRTPRRSTCQPDDVLAAIDEAITRGAVPAAARDRLRARELARVAPQFDAIAFGAPAYARLAPDTAPELARGAHDEGELGAHHDLWQALRVADLRIRLSEFAPAGTDIDIRFAT